MTRGTQNSKEVYRSRRTPAKEIERRLSNLKELLIKEGREAALLVQNVDLYYFTGCMQNAALLVDSEGPPLFMVKKYLERARDESPLQNICAITNNRDMVELIGRHCGRLPRNVGMELDVLPVNLYHRYETLLEHPRVFDVSPLVRRIRSVKSPFELELLREAGELGRRVYQQAPHFIREGVSEAEVAGRLTAHAMTLGHVNYLRTRSFNGEMFTWQVIGGENGGVVGHLDAPFSGLGLSPAFPAGAGLRPIRYGEPVLIDFGTCMDGYMVDQTRMFSLGRPDSMFLEAYEALEKIEASLLARTRPGTVCRDLYSLSLDTARQLGFGHAFLGPPDLKIQFVGHGVGLEINEIPFLARGHDYRLEKGHVFALELKMVFPGRGAVGLENTFAVTETGYEKLTTADEGFMII